MLFWPEMFFLQYSNRCMTFLNTINIDCVTHMTFTVVSSTNLLISNNIFHCLCNFIRLMTRQYFHRTILCLVPSSVGIDMNFFNNCFRSCPIFKKRAVSPSTALCPVDFYRDSRMEEHVGTIHRILIPFQSSSMDRIR